MVSSTKRRWPAGVDARSADTWREYVSWCFTPLTEENLQEFCQELPDVIPPYGVIIMNNMSALLVNQAPRQPSMTKMCLLLCMASGRLFILSALLCFTGAVSSN